MIYIQPPPQKSMMSQISMTNMPSLEFQELHDFVEASTAIFDESHDITHADAVCYNTLKIAETIDAELEFDILIYTAMAHDVCDHKYPASIKEEQLAEFIEGKLGATKCGRVMSIIKNISFSKQIKGLRQQLPSPDSLYLEIVSDADRLEAIGQIGIDRCIAYTHASGGNVPEDVVTHCYEKLLLLKDTYITTSMGKVLAEPLHQVIQDYVDEFEI